jgi:DNA primase
MRSGIPLPQTSEPSPERTALRDRLHEIHRRAQAFYESNLWGERGRGALDYLEGRGLERATLEAFGVGFAPPGWENLLGELGRDFPPSELEEGGLALPRRSGQGHYDRFRGRITFPVRDLSGRVLGFGARAMPGDEEPKYLNSPETPIYRKGEVLYGLDLSRDAIRKEERGVLVEGYLDVIAMHQHGLPVAVAPCGTALTERQARLLGRYAPEVLVNFDADEAGERAALRSLAPFLEAGIEVRVVRLPGGEDPDSYLRSHGAEAYRARTGEALELLDFLLEGATGRGETATARGKRAFLERVVPVLVKVPDRVLRSEYAGRLAERLRIEDGVVLEGLRKSLREGSARLEWGDEEEEGVPRLSLAEGGLLRGILESDAVQEAVLPQLRPGEFDGLPGEPLFRALLALREEGTRPDYRALLDRVGGAEGSYDSLLGRLAAEAGAEESAPDAEGCLQAVRRLQSERSLRRVQHEIQEAQRAGDETRLQELLRRKLELRRDLER